jgi:hypothetical protein
MPGVTAGNVSNLDDQSFTELLYRLEVVAKGKGGTPLNAQETQTVFVQAIERGWVPVSRGPETGGWAGGYHWNLERPAVAPGRQPQTIHLPLP